MPAWLKDHDDTVVMIEGHCDERGTAEYNVALGDRRAKSVRDRLSAYGITPDRISTVSYGKERPACADAGHSRVPRNEPPHRVPHQEPLNPS